MELEEQVMGIIINAGQSRSLCYEALHAAKAGDFATADAKMQEAAHYSREAHLVQTQLIEADEGEGKTKMTLVMVHAQDARPDVLAGSDSPRSLCYILE